MKLKGALSRTINVETITDGCNATDCSLAKGNEPAMADTADTIAIKAAARKFIERYGEDAVRQANLRANELSELRRHQAEARWRLIESEIKALNRANGSIP